LILFCGVLPAENAGIGAGVSAVMRAWRRLVLWLAAVS
jgi:hypothetical protein